jgi:MerR family transcriptional regulator, light-induced transcriptional regulator
MTASIPAGLSIAAVERETGLSKDTLRVWERRYGFPRPGRDEFDERVYPADQVEKLRMIRSLMDQGHRPGKIVEIDVDTLREMAGRPKNTAAAGSDAERADLLHYIALCKAHRVDELRRELSQALLKLGMYRFVTDLVAPLTTMVGNHWAKGNLAVFEEHLYTESVLGVMRGALAGVPVGTLASGIPARPRILLTTIPHEPHALGLLMSEAIFTLEGAHCISLGVQTPIMEIVQAAKAQAADVVALSFSASVRSAHVLEALADLRVELPPAVEIWAGGRSSVLHRRPPASVRVLELDNIRDALIDWRMRFPL